MKRLLLICLLLLNSTALFAATQELKQGWNLLGINSEMTLETLLNKVGIDNLLIVQGEVETYKKSHVDKGKENLNDFTAFKRGKGYWIKVANPVVLEYDEVNYAGQNTLSLNQGWNLMSALADIDLATFIDKVGVDNLLIVQGSQKTYQKNYIEGKYEFLNDLETLNAKQGYWVKVNNAVEISFTFNLNQIAKTNTDEETRYWQMINGQSYDVVVYSDSLPTDETSRGSLAIFGIINGINTKSNLKLNSSYPVNSHFIVKVFDQEGNELAKSKQLEYITSPIDFGQITIDSDDKPIAEEHYQGLKVKGEKLNYQDYQLLPLTKDEFNNLSPENKIIIANKLLAAMFFGMDKAELDQLIASGEFISKIRTKLETSNTDLIAVEEKVNAGQYNYWLEDQQRIIARLYKLSLGKEYINRWVAYVLTQTILFSPGRELDTVGYVDVTNVYNRLVRNLDKENSLQFTTFMHTTSSDNWKRFRSPEDNGREMLEIFLLDFNDSHVPIAAEALKNWHLDRRENKLVIGLDSNTKPLSLFNTTITNGYSFYRELVKSEDFLSGVVSRIVHYYFSSRDKATLEQIINKIVASKPTTFQDIFKQVIFSKEFLLHTQRIKSFEESSLSTMRKVSYYDSINFYDWIDNYWEGMNQYPMRYKLGRTSIIPTDTLSFAYYHNFTRTYLLKNKSDLTNEWQAGWSVDFISKDKIEANISINDFIDYIFEAIISRKALDTEKEMISSYALTRKWGDLQYYNDRKNLTELILDYLSRLSEFYEFKRIN